MYVQICMGTDTDIKSHGFSFVSVYAEKGVILALVVTLVWLLCFLNKVDVFLSEITEACHAPHKIHTPSFQYAACWLARFPQAGNQAKAEPQESQANQTDILACL